MKKNNKNLILVLLGTLICIGTIIELIEKENIPLATVFIIIGIILLAWFFTLFMYNE